MPTDSAWKKQTKLVSQLVSAQEDLFAARQEQQEQIEKIRYQITELKRKSRGTSNANKRSAKLERQITELTSRLDAIEARGGSDVSDEVVKELARIDAKTMNLHLEVDNLGSRVHALESSPVHKIDFFKSKIDVAHKASLDVVTPWVESLFVGLFTFLLTALALNWWIAEDWNWVKDFWASLIVGAAAFFIMASFEKFNLNLVIQARHMWAMKDEEAKEDASAEEDSKVDASV
jgi:hypothetical protein